MADEAGSATINIHVRDDTDFSAATLELCPGTERARLLHTVEISDGPISVSLLFRDVAKVADLVDTLNSYLHITAHQHSKE